MIINDQGIKFVACDVHLIRLFKHRHSAVYEAPGLHKRDGTPLLLFHRRRERLLPLPTGLAPNPRSPKRQPPTSKVRLPFQHQLSRARKPFLLASCAERLLGIATDMTRAAFFAPAVGSSLDRAHAVCSLSTRHPTGLRDFTLPVSRSSSKCDDPSWSGAG